MTAIHAGKSSKALTATRFVAKKVFENHGVNHWSNFPGPTPKTKVAPNPIFPEKYLLTFFEKIFSKNIFFRKICLKNIFQKTFFFKNDISEPRDRQNKHRLEKLMPPEQF